MSDRIFFFFPLFDDHVISRSRLWGTSKIWHPLKQKHFLARTRPSVPNWVIWSQGDMLQVQQDLDQRPPSSYQNVRLDSQTWCDYYLSHAHVNGFLLPPVIRTYQKTVRSVTAAYLPAVCVHLQAIKIQNLSFQMGCFASPWVHQFREFLADLLVPADPEGPQLLSLRGIRALPERWHR